MLASQFDQQIAMAATLTKFTALTCAVVSSPKWREICAASETTITFSAVGDAPVCVRVGSVVYKF